MPSPSTRGLQFRAIGRLAMGAAVLAAAASQMPVRAQSAIPALNPLVTYVMPLTRGRDTFAVEVADLRARLAPTGEGSLIKLGFTNYVSIAMGSWNVDTTNPVAVRAQLANTLNQIDAVVALGVANNAPVGFFFITAIRRSVDPVQTAAELEDRRNVQWYTDNAKAAGWVVHTQYARKLRRIQEAYVREVGKHVAMRMAQHPDILIHAIGDGEVELSSERFIDIVDIETRPGGISWADYSPFAIAEFRDWLRGEGMYATGQVLAGKGYVNRTRYTLDASPAVDTSGDGHTFNGDFNTSFTDWRLRHFDWSLNDNPNADPNAISSTPPFTPLPNSISGGFDAPRSNDLPAANKKPNLPGNAFWEAWIRFRQEMLHRSNLDFAKWMTTSADPVTGATIPADRFYSAQIPTDFLFYNPIDRPDLNLPGPNDQGVRLLTSASPHWTADISPYGSLGVTSYNVRHSGCEFVKTLPHLAPAVAERNVRWGVIEWNPSDPTTTDPKVYRDEMLVVEEFKPALLVPYIWGDNPSVVPPPCPGSAAADWNVQGTGFEIALREFIGRNKDPRPNSKLVSHVTIPANTELLPGQGFTKTWRMKNVGTTAWGSAYRLKYVSGTALSAATDVAVPATGVGGSADISFPLVAPLAAGTYTSVYQMVGPTGAVFGDQVNVIIKVGAVDGSQLVTEITIPANTEIPAGVAFTKTWRIKNTGSTTWGPGYALKFSEGTAMTATTSVAVGTSTAMIAPGATVDVSVLMTPPLTAGDVISKWQIVNPDGVAFGARVSAVIKVVTSDGAQLAAHLTIPPNSDIAPGAAFIKTWRLRNTGTTAWTGYVFKRVGGSTGLTSVASVTVPGTVASGATVDLSVGMTAPTAPGTYDSFWQVSGPSGAFGERVSAQINVVSTDKAEFVSQTVAANTPVAPSASVPQTWRLKNTGTTTWGGTYSLKRVGGSASWTTPATATVPTTAPGATAEISVTVEAPATPGNVASLWQLHAPSGLPFGPKVGLSLGVTPTDNSALDADITLPGNSSLTPGQEATKTWRIKNTGTSVWGAGFKLVRRTAGTDPLTSTESVDVTTTASNATIELSVPITAPTTPGTYVSYWQLANATGQAFGAKFYIQIRVVATDNSQLVTDVTFPDGTEVAPSLAFTKTWKIKNTGTTSWGTGYQLRPIGTSAFIVPSSVNVTSTAPNATIDLSAALTAPAAPGLYTSHWQLFNAEGQPFGARFVAQVRVVASDNSQFVADVTYPDNSLLAPGLAFTKTWRLRNTGSTTWDNTFNLVFMSGDQTGTTTSVALTSTAPGATLDISVPLVAPAGSGTFQSYWQIKNASGQAFGARVWALFQVVSRDNAELIRDLTIPDGMVIEAGVTFTKLWRVRNTGTTSWGTGYTLAFLSGDAMGAPASVAVPTPATAAGELATLSVPMTMPATSGSFTNYWQLKNGAGAAFGPRLSMSVRSATTETLVDDFEVIGDAPATPKIAPGRAFTKTWRVKNTGTTAWGPGYALTFETGNELSTSATPVVLRVLPGASAELTVALLAPAAEGPYAARWRLRTPEGVAFGPALHLALDVESTTNTSDAAQLVGGQTYDRALPGAHVTKQISFKNTGTSTWGAGYRLARVSGQGFGLTSDWAVGLTSPGSTFQIDADLTAPATPGPYTGVWRLFNANGQPFGDPLQIVMTVTGFEDQATVSAAEARRTGVKPSDPDPVTHTWEFRNTGSSTWTGYTLTHVSGLTSTTGTSITLDGAPVLPGGSARARLVVAAPATPGTYESVWRLFNTSAQFGPIVRLTMVVEPETALLRSRDVEVVDLASTAAALSLIEEKSAGGFRLVSSRAPTGGAPAVGIVADGLSHLLLRIRTTEPITVQLADAADGSLQAVATTLAVDLPITPGTTSVTVTPARVGVASVAFLLYRAPDSLGSAYAANTSRTVVLKVRRSAAPTSTPLDVPISLTRQPVLLINGLGEASDTMSSLHDLLRTAWPDLRIGRARVNTQLTIDSAQNVGSVLEAMDNLTRALREAPSGRIAITQVDVIAHSVGGQVARFAAQHARNADVWNFREGRLNKLVTLDTPFCGSALANLIAMAEVGAISNSTENNLRAKYGLSAASARALTSWSSTLQTLGATRVPTFAIAGDVFTRSEDARVSDVQSLLNTDPAAGAAAIAAELNAFANKLGQFERFFRVAVTAADVTAVLNAAGTSVGTVLHDLISGGDHVASRLSQTNGLAHNVSPVVHSPLFANTAGLDAGDGVVYEAAAVRSVILTLLALPASGATFSSEIPAGSACWAGTQPFSDAGADPANDSTTVAVTPAQGTAVFAGESLTVTATYSGAGSLTVVGFTLPFAESIVTASPFTGSFVVPSTYVGELTIAVTARTSGGGIETVLRTVNVRPRTSASGIVVTPESATLTGTGDTRQLALSGVFIDGTRDLTTAASGVVWTSASTAVATVSADGLVTSVGVGQTAITATYDSLTASVALTVARAETQSGGFSLAVQRIGSGDGIVTSTPVGLSCGSACVASFASGTAVTLTAVPSAGSVFVGWAGDADCLDGSVTMTATVVCAANFQLGTGNSIAVSPSVLSFGATVGTNGAIASVTTPQPVTVTFVGNGSTVWEANANKPWITISGGTGTGTGTFTIGINDTTNALAGLTSSTATVTVTATNVTSAAQTVAITINLQPAAASAAPFGQVDTPTQGAAGVVGAVGVTGWVIDDVGVSGVKIYRNCMPFENQASCQTIEGQNVVFIGDAAFVAGARPDVEATFSTYPARNVAGWGYLLLTNMLPNVTSSLGFGGQGPIDLYVFATDLDGHVTLLGRQQIDHTPTSMTMANNTIAKPFGAIDTPSQGGTVSGNLANFGWVLTPDSNTTAETGDILMPTTGASMRVFVDGVSLGNVTYNQCRGNVGNPVPAGQYCNDDVANIFGNATPQAVFTNRTANATRFRNLDAGRAVIGSFDINTRGLLNGSHSIAWGVTDTANRSEGIGSRNFFVLNSAGDQPMAGDTSMFRAGMFAALDLAKAVASVPDHSRVLGSESSLPSTVAVDAPVKARRGFSLETPFTDVAANAAGERHMQIGQMDRLELRLGADVARGFLVANGTLRQLPIGSYLNTATGTFTWAPPPGYLGTYRLAFVTGGIAAGFSDAAILVDVTVGAGRETAAGDSEIRMFVDSPSLRQGSGGQAGIAVSGRPLVVEGWALDPQAFTGSGIGAVHVWARRLDVPTLGPDFLGAATLGVARPDVATAFGASYHAAGYRLTATLAPGLYELTVYAWNERTARWEDARTVRVTVR